MSSLVLEWRSIVITELARGSRYKELLAAVHHPLLFVAGAVHHTQAVLLRFG